MMRWWWLDILYLGLALLIYLLLRVPRLTTDLPYVAYQPKTARTAARDRDWVNTSVTWFALAFLILFAGLRSYDVGLDLRVFYRGAWGRLVAADGTTHTYEWLFTVLMRMGYFIFGAEYGLTFVLVVCAAIIVLCVYAVGKRMTPDVALVMFLMVCCTLYLRGFSTLRQCVASALCVLATGMLDRKKPWWFVLCLILASGFHRATGVIFLPMAVFFVIKKERWQWLIWAEMVFLGLVFVHFDAKLVYLFCRLVNNMFYYDYYIAGNYGYLDLDLFDYLNALLTWACFLGFVAYRAWYRWRYHRPVGQAYNLFLNVYFFAALFYVLSFVSPQFFIYERLTIPFSWAGIFLITHVVANIQHKWVRKVGYVAVMAGALVYAWCLIYMGGHMLIPYKTIS